MPVYRSDDIAAGLRYVYMGPEDWPLWPWMAGQWGVGILSLLALEASLLILRPPLVVGFLLFLVVFPGIAWLLGGPITERLLRHDTGLKYHLSTLQAETAAPRPTQPVSVTTALPAHVFTDHPEAP